MNHPRRPRRAAAAALAVTILLIGRAPLRAQDTEAAKAPEAAVVEPAPETALDAALARTKEHGAATVAVFTAPDQPASARFWNELNAGAWARANRGLVQFVNLSRDDNPELVRTMGVTRFPTVVVYARGPVGVARLGTISDCESADSLTVWLRALDLGLGRPGQADVSVTPTHFGGDVRPSQQLPPSPPPSYPPPQPPAQPQQQVPMFTGAPQQQVTTSTALIQVPSQSLMIQQAPPQVFLAPQPSPVVYVPQMMSAAAPAPAPVGNLFLSAPSVAPAPAPQPSLALSPAPAPAPAPVPFTAPAAAPTALAVNSQTLSLASTGSRSRVRVRGPGLLNSSLARFGERLTRLGRTRIESVQETTLEAPVAAQAPGGLTTISTTSAMPVAPQQPATVILQAPEDVCEHKCKRPCRHRQHAPCQHQAPAPPPAPPQGPPPLAPSPQATPEKSAP